MNEPKQTIRDALLQQEGLAVGPLSQERQKELEMLVTRERARVRRMRWVTASLWILLAGMFVFWGVSGAERHKLESPILAVLFLITRAVLLMAVLSSISLYIRWQIANRRELNLRLQNLEDELTRLRQQKSS